MIKYLYIHDVAQPRAARMDMAPGVTTKGFPWVCLAFTSERSLGGIKVCIGWSICSPGDRRAQKYSKKEARQRALTRLHGNEAITGVCDRGSVRSFILKRWVNKVPSASGHVKDLAWQLALYYDQYYNVVQTLKGEGCCDALSA